MARKFRRRYGCEFCREGMDLVDYKDVERLKKYLSTRGKILPRRQTGTCAYHQRQLSRAIKRARQMALLPYVEVYTI